MEINEILLLKQRKKSLERFAKEQSDSARRKVVYWVIRCIPYINEDNTESLRIMIQLIKLELKRMTYRELVNMFPIEKWYDGDKWGTKDYFYTVNYINEKGIDNLIKDPFELIWEYQNLYIRELGVKWIGCVNNDMRTSTGIDILNAFFNPEAYPKDNRKNLIGIDSKGKVHKVSNPHATKLKVIK